MEAKIIPFRPRQAAVVCFGVEHLLDEQRCPVVREGRERCSKRIGHEALHFAVDDANPAHAYMWGEWG